MQTFINYEGRVWTCLEHHERIVALIELGEELKASALVDLLNPKKSRGICRECDRLYRATPPCNR